MIQTELKAPKGQYNSFGKYKYRSCEDILEGLKPLLKEHGASVIISDEMVLIGDRYYIKATAKLMDQDGEISTNGYAREEESKKGQDASQTTGSASSYARKYALNGLFAIDDTKDSDATNDHEKGDKQPTDPKIDEIKLNALMAMLYKLDDAEDYTKKLLSYYKVKDLKDLTVTQYAKAVKSVQSKL